jgi:hypothetical protein
MTTAWYWYLAHLVWVYGSYAACTACIIWAIWKGGPTEKQGAALIAFGWILTTIVTRFDGPGPGIYVKILDFACFLIWVALALHSRRLWVFVLCMCMLNGLVTYFATDHKAFGLYAYMTAVGFWLGYAQLICLAGGIIDYQNTLKRQKLNPAPEA